MPAGLRLLIDARMVTSNTHGIGRYTLNLIRGLQKSGLKPSILSHDERTPEIIGKEYVEKVIPCRFAFANPAETVELTGVVRSKDFDLFHFPSFAVPLQTPKNSVITIHDLIHLYAPSRWAHHVYYKTIVKRALRQCGQVITDSQWSKDEITQILKTPESKIKVVRLGLEDRWFGEPMPSSRPLAEPFFLALGSPKKHKNIPTLISACQQLWAEGNFFKLVLSLGGEGWPAEWPLRPDFKENVKVVKNLKDQELMAYFNHAQALVSPSFYEGYNLPAAEGLVLGKTVILSSAAANQEMRGQNLHMYSPPDNVPALAASLSKCLTIQSDPAGTESKRPQHNIPSLKTMVEETIKVYELVLGKSLR